MKPNRGIVVIGAAYGDEGKGKFTDYWSDRILADYVVRFNGGAQAGHTVELKNNAHTRHVFSHFGCGTFNYIPTVWGHRCVVNPMIFWKEREELLDLGYCPIIFIHKDCYVTTPFDVLVNQAIEDIRSVEKHGSVGVGFGETIERNEGGDNLRLTMDMLKDARSVSYQFSRIQHNYFVKRLSYTFPDMSDSDILDYVDKYEVYSEKYDKYFDMIEYLLKYSVTIDDYYILNNSKLVFEGAQGLLLDQDNVENFPHVTRSSTGLTNVIEIVNEIITPINLDVMYVARSYTTRHGAGNLPNETIFPEHLVNADKTNVPNTYQGSLRYAPMNMESIIQVSTEDAKQLNELKNHHKKGHIHYGITWTDDYSDLEYTNIINHLQPYTTGNILFSDGPTNVSVSKDTDVTWWITTYGTLNREGV